MTTRDKLIEIIRNSDECYDCCSIKIGYLADRLIKSGLIKDETIYSPTVFIAMDMNCAEFICPKCDKVVSMVELSAIGNPCINPQPKIEEVKKLSQMHYKYCMYCGAKLKE